MKLFVPLEDGKHKTIDVPAYISAAKNKIWTVDQNGSRGIHQDVWGYEYRFGEDGLKQIHLAKEFILTILENRLKITRVSRMYPQAFLDLSVLSKNREREIWLSLHRYGWTKRSSYGWKHAAEAWADHYISNGAFIVAAVEIASENDYPIQMKHISDLNPDISFHSRQLALTYDYTTMFLKSHKSPDFSKIKEDIQIILGDAQ